MININVPDGKSGEWEVSSFKVKEREFSQVLSYFKTGRSVPGGIYKRLLRNKQVVMSNTPDEIRDFRYFLNQAEGNILINGLGIGVLVKALIQKENVQAITIIENSKDVIRLSGPTYSSNPKVTIIHADCFTWQSPKGKRYNAVWHDIWDTISSDNLEEMKKLHRKYGRKADYQESWCRDICENQRKEEKQYFY